MELNYLLGEVWRDRRSVEQSGSSLGATTVLPDPTKAQKGLLLFFGAICSILFRWAIELCYSCHFLFILDKVCRGKTRIAQHPKGQLKPLRNISKSGNCNLSTMLPNTPNNVRARLDPLQLQTKLDSWQLGSSINKVQFDECPSYQGENCYVSCRIMLNSPLIYIVL
jgi:hypothetical protein